MFQRTLLGSTLRAGSRQIYGSGSERQFHSFSGLIKNSKIESSILGNLGMKLGSVRVVENVSLPSALSFRSFIHSGEKADGQAGRTAVSMNYGREVEAGRTTGPMSYGREVGARTAGPMNYGREVAAGRTAGSMDYVRGLLQQSGSGVSGRPPLYQPQVGVGRNPRPMDPGQGFLLDRGDGLNGQPLPYQSQVESNADVVNIKLMRNNCFVTVTDSKGNRKFGTTAAMAAAKGEKPGRYSGEAAAEEIGRRVRQMKTRSVVVKVNGLTFFRRKKDAILAFKDGYTNSRGDMNPVVYIEDTTRKPHNGCRLPKKRRI